MIRARLARPAIVLTSRNLTRIALPAAAVLCSLAVYLLTMAPSAFAMDSSEMAAGAATLGIVHSPGYPVYLLLTHLFTHLPFGDLAYRANLASAVFSALSAGLLVALVRDITGRSLAALVAGLAFAFCFYTWSLSVVAEVYTLQALFLVLILFCAWRWRQGGRNGFLVALAFLTGLAAANNPATALWWPGLLLILWTSPGRTQLSRQQVLKALLAFLAGLAFILYAPIRSMADPAVNYMGQYDSHGTFHKLDLTRPENFLWYLSGRQFDWAFFAYDGPELLGQAGRFSYQLFGAFLGAGLIVALIGAWRLLRKQAMLAAGLLLIALLHALFFITYRTPDKETMFLPVYLVTAVFLGLGLARIESLWPRLAKIAAPLLIAALLVINSPYADASNLSTPRDDAEARLRLAEPGAFYLAVWGDAAAMEYLQVAEGLRTDVTVINILMIEPDKRSELVDHALAEGRAVYSTFDDPALRNDYRFEEFDYGYLVGSNNRPSR